MRNPDLDGKNHAWLTLREHVAYGIIAGVMLAILICRAVVS